MLRSSNVTKIIFRQFSKSAEKKTVAVNAPKSPTESLSSDIKSVNKSFLMDALLTNPKLSDLSRNKAKEAVNCIFQSILTATLDHGKIVGIRKFGSFYPKNRNAYKARKPKTGESVDVPATRRLGFNVSRTTRTTIEKFESKK